MVIFISVINSYAFKPISVTTDENIALEGYDTVAYFIEKKAVKGSPFYIVEWQGVIWQFSSKTNVKLFKNEPEKYAPQFGGYCAYGLSEEELVSCDPEAFVILEEKLYVLKNKTLRDIWIKDPRRYVAIAKDHWLKLLGKYKKEGLSN